MKSATIHQLNRNPVADDETTIGKFSDYASPLTPRQQSRYSATLTPSAPPFKPSRIRNLIVELLLKVAA